MITKTELQKTLSAVAPGLLTKDIISQASCFIFKNDRVYTYNDEISISAPIVIEGAHGAVQAAELLKLVTKFTKEELELEFTERELRITAGRSRAGIILSTDIKLPLDAVSEITEWQALPKVFKNALEFCHWVCSKNMTSAVLTCVNIRPDGFVEASDNMRIARFKLDSPMECKEPFLIPGEIAEILAKYDTVEFCVNNGWAHFRTFEGIIFSCRIFSQEFPEVGHFFDVSGKYFQLPRTMNEVLERAGIFSKGRLLGDEQVTITMLDKRMVIRGEGSIGWYEETLNLKYDGDPMQFTISPGLLKDILGQVSTAVLTDNYLLFEGEDWKYITLLELSQ